MLKILRSTSTASRGKSRAIGMNIDCPLIAGNHRYKCYAAHISQLYVSKDAQKHLRTLGHFFKTTDSLENLLGLAAANYELTASIPAVISYLESVSWDAIAEYEQTLQAILIDYLNSKPDVYQIYGEPVVDKAKRVPVISWTVKGRSSRDIVEAMDKKSNYGCRFGAFYSNRLVEEVLGLDPDDGVVRLSALHYNTGMYRDDRANLKLTSCRG